MNFILFFIFYILCTLILSLILFISYKLFLKKLIFTKLSENALLSAFDSLDQKSILDIPIEKKEEKKEDEKVYTYF